MKKAFFILVLLFPATTLIAQQQKKTPVYFQFASQQNRAKMYKKLVDTTIRLSLADPLADSTEGEWNEAFWAMELVVYKNDFSKQKLTQAWKQAPELSEDFQNNLIEASYALYPTEFKQGVTNLLHATSSIPIFIRCAEYLLRADAATAAIIQPLIQTKFGDTINTGLTILQNRIASPKQTKPLPPLKDLFDKNFLKDQTVIYSFQRKNRDYPGLVIIRKADGKFIKNKDGIIFHVPQLARAITNYPFYITNGNTPQGILRFTGFAVSGNYAIGPTANLQLSLPYEAKAAIFFNDSSLEHTLWQKEMYASLLPVSWKNNEALYESFYAGAMGRSAIIMHGTTVNPAYYKGQLYYPQTPSLGCLCSYEEWGNNGLRIKSYQQQIVDALDDAEINNGYVVVINLNNDKKAVSIDEVKKYAPNP